MSALLTKIDEKNIATVTLNRPLVHNAIDDQVILELMNVLRDFEQKPQIRAVLLTANGPSFCAGADLQWMKRMSTASQDENLRDAEQLAGVMRRLNIFPRPTVALVQGAAYGGGVGLVAACDVAVASEGATFSLSEVKLGLIPSVISPYVIAAMGARAARRYVLTGERFGSAEALRLGLVHEVVPADHLTRTADRIIAALLDGGPRAHVEAKKLVFDVAGKPIEPALIDETTRRIASIRATNEGKEGVAAFLDKRKPNWIR
jgi:methylglutaconyl-CoA hydratase